MNEFWLATLSLTLLALLIVIVPVYMYRKNPTPIEPGNTYESKNIAIFKDRLAELDVEKEAGILIATDYDQLVSELRATLLIDAEIATVKRSSQASLSSLILIFTCLALIPVSAYLIYFELGSIDQLNTDQSAKFDNKELEKAKRSAESGDMSELLEQLHEKLLENQDNIEGWALLARSAMNTRNYQLAEEAYLQIIRVLDSKQKNPAAVYGLLAQARYYSSNETMTGNVDSAIKEALARDPDEVNSLGLLAIHSFTINKFETAIEYWERILNATPDHPSRSSIEAGIDRARIALGLPQESNHITEDQNIQAGDKTEPLAQITVNLSLSPELKSQVADTDIIFLFAKSSGKSGPSMPLAAKKIRVKDLPIQLILSDKNSMGPMAKLSDATKVNVSARVSFSGQPIASPGDFEGKAKTIEVFENKVISLVINRKL